MLNEINEMIIAYNTQKDDQDDEDDDHGDGAGEREQNEQQGCQNPTETSGNFGTLNC